MAAKLTFQLRRFGFGDLDFGFLGHEFGILINPRQGHKDLPLDFLPVMFQFFEEKRDVFFVDGFPGNLANPADI